MEKIFILEDDKVIKNELRKLLISNGYAVVEKSPFDLALLDVNVPGESGYEVCRKIRSESDVPVIFLTALGEENDIVDGYEVGADEYVTKPYSTKLLLVKVNALIKRYHGLMTKNGRIVVDEIEIEPARRYVTVNGKEVVMAPKEYELMMYFIDNNNIALSRDKILDAVWGMDYEGYDRAVDTHVKKLRAALGKASRHIETVVKVGYMWKNYPQK